VEKTWDEKSVFLAALELPQEQRAIYLRTACPDEAARQRIESLLEHHEVVTRELLNAVPPDEGETATEALKRIDEFQIIRKLGEGGMGVVYLAEDLILGRRVALKVLSLGLRGSEQAIDRFRTEARCTAAINHPGIVPVFKFGADGGTHYIACEFVDGPTLAQVIETERGGRRERVASTVVRNWCRTAAETICAIAEALEAAHRNRIVHRDVKPSNILMDPAHGPRLTDFGVAKHFVEEGRTLSTTLIGSCHYMSPEQASIAATEVDQRSDVFSLGIVLYELLALRRPFTGDSQYEILKAVAEKEPLRLRLIDERIPRDLEVVCQKCLEKRPRDRYQTAAHVAADLGCFLHDRPILALPPSLRRRARHWIAKRKLPVLVGFSLSLVVVGGVLFTLLASARAERYAWVAAECDVPNSDVYLQHVDAESFEVDPVPQFLGRTPLKQTPLAIGQYRLTVVSPTDNDWVEFDVAMLDPGKAHVLKLLAHHVQSGVSSRYIAQKFTRHAWFRGNATSESGQMLLIPAGSYPSGWSSTEDVVLVRMRWATLPAFLIDRCEVSNGEYRAFLDATGRPPPEPWRRYGYDTHFDDHPVFSVTIEDAESYARWKGKRLPTALEWQAAMRTKNGWAYPWGDQWEDRPAFPTIALADLEKARYSWDEGALYHLHCDQTVGVASKDECATPAGLLHGFDNVRELTSSIVLSKRDVIIMGRGWADPPKYSTLGQASTSPIDAKSFENGFRCARSAAPPRPQTNK